MAIKEKLQSNSKTSFFILVGMSTAILLAAPVIILTFLGIFFDSLFHTGKLFLIIGVIAGFIGGMINVYRLLSLMQNQKK